MRLLKNLKLRTKVSIGFGVILILLMISVVFSLFGIARLNNIFSMYTEIARNQMLVGRIQANLLESRLAAEKFIQLGEESYKDTFKARFEKMEGFIFELNGGMQGVEEQKNMERILAHSREYKDDFNKIITYNNEKADLYDILADKGPEIEKSLLQILETASIHNNEQHLYRSGKALNNLLAARLEVSRFLELNDFERTDKVMKLFTEMDRQIDYLKSSSTGDNDKALLERIEADKEIYVTNFIKIASVIKDRNDVISHQREIGAEVSAVAEDIKLLIIEEQSSYDPIVKREYQLLITKMVIVAALALLLSIIISIGIIKMVVFPVKTVTDTFRDISEGEADLEVRLKVDSKDELGEMAKFFNKFMEKLQIIMTENKNQSWLKTGQAELSEKMSGEHNIKTLSCNIICYVARYLNADIGTLYIKSDDNIYELEGGYAYKKYNEVLDRVHIGEGIVGQAILTKENILVSDVPKDYFKIRSGAGESVPKNIIVVPCIANNEVICVMEIGSFKEFTPIQQVFLAEVGEVIAISVSSLKARLKTEELLDKTLIQSEELQVQQEELRQSNEEFEEQTRALKESEERLQAQQEELRVINEELIEHSRNLEQQKSDINKKNEYLLEAQKEIQEKAEALEVANKYKTEFLANMSHELRTPLNSILVLSQLLANKKDQTPLTEKQLEFASTIHSSGSELLRLINDVLDLSKIEVGKMDVLLEPMSFKELAYDMEKSFSQISENKGLDFKIVVDKELPEFILTDAHKVKQITNNFLSNAFKFTEKGEVRLEISCKDKETISVSVSDTGIGIREDKHSIVFEAFKQSDGTISRKYGGTGLGLSITKELAKLLGGSIQLISKEGEGSTFALLLPLKSSINQETQEVSKSIQVSKDTKDMVNLENEQMHQKEIASEKEKSLLIIEDDHHFANILQELAGERGYNCTLAVNGEEGILSVKKHRPDAILLDIGLPDINGWEVIARLKEAGMTNIPIHILSGNDDTSDSSRKDGVIGYMQKPVSIEKIQQVFTQIERVAAENFKKILIVGINENDKESINEIIYKEDTKISSADTAKDAIHLLKTEEFDCMILDINTKDISGLNFLEQAAHEHLTHMPIIIYTQDQLSPEDALKLQKYVKSIIIKGKQSKERLVAEVNLFLHGLDSKNDDKKQKIIRTTLEKEESLQGRKILIVDDDMRNVFALSSILEERGMKIAVGRNGKEGLNKLKEHTDIDLVLMDIMMPEMDGYTAIREIRKDKRFSKKPIIALTAKAMKEDRQKCIEAGANDYLTKPIEIDRLISLLRVWLYK
ncbi:MAG: barA [Clostridia bacterium]|jgi:CheY-like chemotaxis protein/CHASE3 domain sensor protein|nr:barA [Clostridia bacterium]